MLKSIKTKQDFFSFQDSESKYMHFWIESNYWNYNRNLETHTLMSMYNVYM